MNILYCGKKKSNSVNNKIIMISSFITHSGVNAVVKKSQAWRIHLTPQSGGIKKKPGKMNDPGRVVSYEDMLKVINQPEKIVIDVRNPDEITRTGKIPSSINIPLQNVDSALSMSDEDFRRNFKRKKPTNKDELIFYCRSGRRSSEALDKALNLGYVKTEKSRNDMQPFLQVIDLNGMWSIASDQKTTLEVGMNGVKGKNNIV